MRKIGTHPGMPEGQKRRKRKMKTIEEVLQFERKEIKKKIKSINGGEAIYDKLTKVCLTVAQASISNANGVEGPEEKLKLLTQGLQSVIDSITAQHTSYRNEALALNAKLELLEKLLDEDKLRKETDDDDND